MPSSEHFSMEINEALRRGRAIPMLVDYRPPEMPDHTLTVIGVIDGADFQGAFLPDDYAGEELVRLTLPLNGLGVCGVGRELGHGAFRL